MLRLCIAGARRRDRDRPPREQGADGAPAQHVALQAGHREVRRRRARHRFVAGLHVEQTDAVGPDLAGEPAAAPNRHRSPRVQSDAPTEEEDRRGAAEAFALEVVGCRAAAEPAAEIEDPLPFQEELALLGKEQAEPRQVDLLLVHLHLREVGVVGEVCGQPLRHAVLHVDPEVAARIVRQPGCGIDVGRHVGDGIRLDFQPGSGLRHLDAYEGGGRGEPEHALERERGRNRCQERPLVGRGDVALEIDAPGLRRTCPVAQRLEGNGHLQGPALLETAGPDVPHSVPVEVGGPLVRNGGVEQRAQRVGDEVEAVAAVVVGVEHHREGLVAEHAVAVALHLVGDDAVRIGAPAARGDVQGVPIEQHPDLGLVPGRRAFVRLLLNEVGHRRHGVVDAFVELPVELQRTIETNRPHGGAALGVARDHLRRKRRRGTVDDRGDHGETGTSRCARGHRRH